MGWSTIRKASNEDYEILNRKAQEFADRHSLRLTDWQDCGPWRALGLELGRLTDSWQTRNTGKRLSRLWLRVLRRALGSKAAEGIAWGYVGYHVD